MAPAGCGQSFQLLTDRIDELQVVDRENIFTAKGDGNDFVRAELVEKPAVVLEVVFEKIGLDGIVKLNLDGEPAQEDCYRQQQSEYENPVAHDGCKNFLFYRHWMPLFSDTHEGRSVKSDYGRRSAIFRLIDRDDYGFCEPTAQIS
jgi:hypothetical protein